MSEKAMTLSERLRAPKAWMAWHDFGAVTIAGDPIPAMDHDSQAPREAADALDARDARIAELEGALRVAIKHWEGWCNQNNGSLPDNVMGGEADDYARAREALK